MTVLNPILRVIGKFACQSELGCWPLVEVAITNTSSLLLMNLPVSLKACLASSVRESHEGFMIMRSIQPYQRAPPSSTLSNRPTKPFVGFRNVVPLGAQKVSLQSKVPISAWIDAGQFAVIKRISLLECWPQCTCVSYPFGDRRVGHC